MLIISQLGFSSLKSKSLLPKESVNDGFIASGNLMREVNLLKS